MAPNPNIPSQQPRTGRSKAGAKGGRKTAALHGHAFFQRIGRKGGKARGRAPAKDLWPNGKDAAAVY